MSMDTRQRQMELRTIWSNLDLGVRKQDWGIVDRASQRLASLVMNHPREES